MKLNTNSWHYKVYVFNSQLVAAWRDKEEFVQYPSHGAMIGLCPYMRMILLWGPLVMALNLIPLSLIIYSLFSFPVAVNGSFGFVWVIGSILAIALLVYVVCMALSKLSDRRQQRRWNKIYDQYDDQEPEEKPETFWSLFWGYVKAVKTKICPVLEVDK